MDKLTRYAFRGARGMTLIELMVVVAIIAILVSVAYAGYRGQIQKTRRADGKTTLVRVSQQLERCFTRFHSYNAAGCGVATDIADGGMLSSDGWYLVTDDNASATTFRLVATPQGKQASDTQCADLRLTHTGVRDATGTAPGGCW